MPKAQFVVIANSCWGSGGAVGPVGLGPVGVQEATAPKTSGIFHFKVLKTACFCVCFSLDYNSIQIPVQQNLFEAVENLSQFSCLALITTFNGKFFYFWQIGHNTFLILFSTLKLTIQFSC